MPTKPPLKVHSRSAADASDRTDHAIAAARRAQELVERSRWILAIHKAPPTIADLFVPHDKPHLDLG
jgi:hypothetical protein